MKKPFFVICNLVLFFINNISASNFNKEELWNQIRQDKFPELLAEDESAKVAQASLDDLKKYENDTSLYELFLNRAYFINMLNDNKKVCDSLLLVAEKRVQKSYNENIGYSAVYDYLRSLQNASVKLDTLDVQKKLQHAYDSSELTPSAQWWWIKGWILKDLQKIDFANSKWKKVDSLSIGKKLWVGGILPIRRWKDSQKDALLISGGTRQPLSLIEKDSAGNWVHIEEEAGLKDFPGGEVLYSIDYNNDGYDDLFILRKSASGKSEKFIPNSLLKNNRNGTFTDVTNEVGLTSLIRSSCACFTDVNEDGLLDIFIGGESTPSRFYIQDVNGQFKEQASSLGVHTTREKIVDCAVLDLNADGKDDLYLSVLGANNRAYVKEKLQNEYWFFVDKAESLGMTTPLLGGHLKVGDFDGDGLLELMANTDASFDSEVSMHAINGLARGMENSKLYKLVEMDTMSSVELPVELSASKLSVMTDGGLDSRSHLIFGGGMTTLDFTPMMHYKYFFVPTQNSGIELQVPEKWPLYVHSLAFADVNGDLRPQLWVKGGERYPIMQQEIISYEYDYPAGRFVYVRPQASKNSNIIGSVVKLMMRDKQGKVYYKTRKIMAEDSRGNGTGQFLWYVPEGFYLINASVKWPNNSVEMYYFTHQQNKYILREGDKYPVLID